MTARQVIEEIKTLSPQERAEVADFLRELQGTGSIRVADDEEVDRLTDKIFDKHAELMRKLAS